jgi:hypothetical protein
MEVVDDGPHVLVVPAVVANQARYVLLGPFRDVGPGLIAQRLARRRRGGPVGDRPPAEVSGADLVAVEFHGSFSLFDGDELGWLGPRRAQVRVGQVHAHAGHLRGVTGALTMARIT